MDAPFGGFLLFEPVEGNVAQDTARRLPSILMIYPCTISLTANTYSHLHRTAGAV